MEAVRFLPAGGATWSAVNRATSIPIYQIDNNRVTYGADYCCAIFCTLALKLGNVGIPRGIAFPKARATAEEPALAFAIQTYPICEYPQLRCCGEEWATLLYNFLTDKDMKISPHLTFAGLLGVSILAGWSPLSYTLKLAWRHDEYTHILLVLPISLGLALFHWRNAQTKNQPEIVLGWVLLATPLVIAILARIGNFNIDARSALEMASLVAWWIGSVVVCFGTQNARVFLFPLLFLFAMVPIPPVALQHVVGILQRESTSLTRILFELAAVPVSQAGTTLSIPGLNLEVAAECSSIRSSTMLLLTSLVLMHLFLRSWWGKLLFLLVTLPLSVVKNAIRIFTLTLLGTRLDPGFLTGRLHQDGGIVFFTVALVILVFLMRLLQWAEGLSQGPPQLKRAC